MKNNYFKLVLLFFGLAFLIILPASTQAHSGRTNGSGCHTCRTNCEKYGLNYDEYHCHNGGPAPAAPSAPAPTPVSTPRPTVVPTPRPRQTPPPISTPIVTPRPIPTPTPPPTPAPSSTPKPTSTPTPKATPRPQKRAPRKHVDFVRRFSLPA